MYKTVEGTRNTTHTNRPLPNKVKEVIAARFYWLGSKYNVVMSTSVAAKVPFDLSLVRARVAEERGFFAALELPVVSQRGLPSVLLLATGAVERTKEG